MGIKIAIGGKGGVGKTTICAVLAQLFARDGFEVLALDADPTSNLASAFGIPREKTPPQLIEMKQLIAERTGTQQGAIGAYFKLNPKVSDLPEKYSLDVNGVKLLVIGGITQAGSGCACPEGAFLKTLLTHTILQRREMVLVDLAAGLECMGRASVKGIDAFIVVVEPGSRSIEVAKNIANMAKELGIKHVFAIANKITDDQQTEAISSALTNIDLLAIIKQDSAIQQADLSRTAVINAGDQLVNELTKAKKQLTDLLSGV